MQDTEIHTLTVANDFQYYLRIPEEVGTRSIVVLTLHGYGSTPEAMLRLTVPFVGPEHIVASLRGINQQYAAYTPGGAPGSADVVYNWGTSKHGDLNIALHHRMVLATLAQLRDRFRVAPSRCLLIGFSQAVGLNYRFIGMYPDAVGGVIGICGGVPRDWQEDKYQPVAAPFLHIARTEDEIFPPATTQTFAERLRRHASDVEFHLLPGGHRFPSKAGEIVSPWLKRVFS